MFLLINEFVPKSAALPPGRPARRKAAVRGGPRRFATAQAAARPVRPNASLFRLSVPVEIDQASRLHNLSLVLCHILNVQADFLRFAALNHISLDDPRQSAIYKR